jgi:NAD(P)H-dependent FMN reductase
MNDNAIKIIAICGSLNSNSKTRKTLEIALEGAAGLGAEIEMLDLRDFDLPFCTGEDDDIQGDVLKLRKKVKESHGVLIGTPEYHGSFSGVLKNALDLMGFNEFEGKMLGLVGVSAGDLGALNAINHLRMIGRSLHSWVVPEQVSIPNSWDAFDQNGKLKNEKFETRLLELGRKVARFAYLHSSEKTKEFVEAWEQAPDNPGARLR